GRCWRWGGGADERWGWGRRSRVSCGGGCCRRCRGNAHLASRRLAVSKSSEREEGQMRVSATFNRLLRVEGARVESVAFAREGVVVGVGLRGRRRVCSCCGQLAGVTYDTGRRR